MLQKPRKAFRPIVRKVLVVVYWLHVLKKNPEASEKAVWNYLLRTFSLSDVLPSEHDLLDHKLLIMEAAKRDKELKGSKSFRTFVGKCETRTTFYKDVEITNDGYDDEDNDSSDDQEIFDQVCSICDDGGNILCCNGRCLRSFHPTVADGVNSQCASLGFRNKAEYEAIPIFLCENCLHQKHQCFACGRLGVSARSSSQEVFPCASATCGHFYHPECVARLLHPGNETQVEELGAKIAAGESFACPAHKCFVCNQREVADVDALQFAMCRRCPKAYHRKCLPGEITFERDGNEHNITRAWEGLLANQRILIYCSDHKIGNQLKTPARDHLIFPNIERKYTSDLIPRKRKLVIPKRTEVSEGFAVDRTAVDSPKPVKNLLSGLPKWKLQNIASSKIKNTTQDKPAMEKLNSLPLVDAEMEKRILALMDEVSSSFDVEEFKQRKAGDTHLFREKPITLGLVEGSVKAVRTALQKLEEGCSVDDAKTVCQPEILKQIFRWKTKLRVYLSPFLYGARYTSFGRHFTQVGKLKEIVERLQWYVQESDMIVDFCCGSNDFSCLLKEKLEKSGKMCFFKNYDIIQAKNDCCFEKKDWLNVGWNELPDGSRLIMGLNPPFGVKSSLANAFIRKALEFKPKVIVLIVPKETERLDRIAAYNLIWVDDTLLSGKSFYLPGSVDVNNKQIEDWNLSPPPLYLWSRADWTARHTEIARACGHI